MQQHLPYCWPGGLSPCMWLWCPDLVPRLKVSFHSGLPSISFKGLKIASPFHSRRSFLTLDKPVEQKHLPSRASCLSALIEYLLYRASCHALWKIIEEGDDALLAFEHLINLQDRQNQHKAKHMSTQMSARHISFIIYKSN